MGGVKVHKSKAPTFVGDPCEKCGGTDRYVRNKGCVGCYREARRRGAETARTNNPAKVEPPRLDKDWPRVETASGDRVLADPIAVLMSGKKPPAVKRGRPKNFDPDEGRIRLPGIGAVKPRHRKGGYE